MADPVVWCTTLHASVDILIRERPRGGSARRDRRARTTCSCAMARSPRSGPRGDRRARRSRGGRGARTPPLPGLRRSARPPAHARPGAQGGYGDRHPRRRRRRLLCACWRCPTPTRCSTLARCCARCATRPRRDARIPVGFMPAITRGLNGTDAHRDGRAARGGRPRLHRRRPPRRQRRHAAQGAAVPAPLRRRASRCTRRTRRSAATAPCTRATVSARLGVTGIPSISESTMVARDAADRRVRGRPDPHPAPERPRVRPGARPRQRAWGAGHRRGLAAPPLSHPRRGAHARHADEDEPAAAHRGRSPGADRGTEVRRDRLHRDRPRAPRARREGDAVRAGADGDHRSGDRRSRRSTPSWSCRGC